MSEPEPLDFPTGFAFGALPSLPSSPPNFFACLDTNLERINNKYKSEIIRGRNYRGCIQGKLLLQHGSQAISTMSGKTETLYHLKKRIAATSYYLAISIASVKNAGAWRLFAFDIPNLGGLSQTQRQGKLGQRELVDVKHGLVLLEIHRPHVRNQALRHWGGAAMTQECSHLCVITPL
jgi:hypothetical protein